MAQTVDAGGAAALKRSRKLKTGNKRAAGAMRWPEFWRLAFWIVLIAVLAGLAQFVVLAIDRWTGLCAGAPDPVARACTFIADPERQLSFIAAAGLDAGMRWADEKLGAGSGAALGGLFVFFGALLGLWAPARQERCAQRERAKALVQALAAEVDALASWAHRFRTSDAAPVSKREKREGHLLFENVSPRRMALLRLPESRVFQAELDELDSLAHLKSDAHVELTQRLIVWHAYADQVRSMQGQLAVSINHPGPAAGEESPHEILKQTIMDRVGNLYEGTLWNKIRDAFKRAGIELSHDGLR